ncbi:MAG: Uma2 family endonuclease [Selenomonadaceae bacterium]|nr:Uma2 family endonuclease [Selenomonadaceae bacterium]
MEAALAYREEYEKYELINGEVHMMSRPSFEHGDVEVNIANLFRTYLRCKRCRALLEPNVRLSDKDQFIPDVVIVCNPEILNDPWIEGVPDLVVEVLSPSTARYDKFSKKALYEKYGVKEYWIVDPANRTIEIYHLVEGKFELDDFYVSYRARDWENLDAKEKAEAEAHHTIKVSLYEDFTVEVADVFRDVD